MGSQDPNTFSSRKIKRLLNKIIKKSKINKLCVG